jgi:hypothetical protein
MNTNTASTPNKLNIPILKFPLATSSPTKQKLNIMSEPVLAQFIQKHRTIVHHHFNSDLDNGIKAHNLLKSMVDPKTKKTYDDDNDSLISLRSKLGVDEDEGISIIDMSSPESSERLCSLKSSNSTLSVKELDFAYKVESDSVTEDLDSSQHSSETLAVSDDFYTKEDSIDKLSNYLKTEGLDSSQDSNEILLHSDLHAKDNYTEADSTKQNLEISSNILDTSPDKISSGLEPDSNPIPETLNFNQSDLKNFKLSSNSEESVNNIYLQDSPQFCDINDEIKTSQIGTNLDLINGGSSSSLDILNLTDIEFTAGEIKTKEESSKSGVICSQLEIQTPIINLEDTLDSPELEAYESFNGRVDRENNNLKIADNITQDQFNSNSLKLNFQETEVNAETETELKDVEAAEIENEFSLDEENSSVENESDTDDLNDTTVTSIRPPSPFDLDDEDYKLEKLAQLNISSSSSTVSLQSLPACSETFKTDMNSIYSRLLTKVPSLSHSSTHSLTSDTQPETLNNDTDADITQIDMLDVSELKQLVLELAKSNERINTWYRGISHHIPNTARIAYNKLKSAQSEKLVMLKNLVNNNSYSCANSDYEYFNMGSSSLSLQSSNTLPCSNSKSFLEKKVNINEFVENYRDHSTRVELAKYLARAGRY